MPCFIVILMLSIVLFPIKTTKVISGDGHILTFDKEKIGDCEISIEIKEIHSLIFHYRKTFSFVLDGDIFSEFDAPAFIESRDGVCSISQMYYDKTKHRFELYVLIYDRDLSYAAIAQDENMYFINPDENMPFSEIPFVKVPA